MPRADIVCVGGRYAPSDALLTRIVVLRHTYDKLRAALLAGSFVALGAPAAPRTASAADQVTRDALWGGGGRGGGGELEEAAARAREAYARRKLPEALSALDDAVALAPDEGVWYERRGQVQVDLKDFEAALADFERAKTLYPANYVSIGLLGNQALAHEGLAQWVRAVDVYSLAIDASEEAGQAPPYLFNARGNCRVALGDFEAAFADFERSAEIFQVARDLRGSIFAQSNAALLSAQLGREDATRRLEAAARRAPGSVDMRAALAAQYYSQGKLPEAEAEWDWACTRINTGQLYGPEGPTFDSCLAYRDADWLTRIRRWPPVMVERMQAFVKLDAGAEE